MTYDFSTIEKREAFIKALQERSSDKWSEPLPNLKWISAEEFASSEFFMYSTPYTFMVNLGGPNKKDNLKQLPLEIPKEQHTWALYPRVFMGDDMKGFVILSSRYMKPARIWFGKFAFCNHDHTDGKNLGRCYNQYTCKDCGYSWAVDSSD